MLISIACILFGITLVAIVLLIILDFVFVQRLRRNHTAVWERLEKPSPWFTQLKDLLRLPIDRRFGGN